MKGLGPTPAFAMRKLERFQQKWVPVLRPEMR